MSATAETLIRDLSTRGVRLSRNGDRLRVEGAITPEDRQALAEAKPAILAALSGADTSAQRERLLTLADAERIDRAHVHALPVADVDACAGLPDLTLRDYLRALRDTHLRERGQVPPDETATIRCHHCGPVFAAIEVALVLPIIAGLPTAAACLWCRNRKKSLPIPRPAGY